MLLNVNDLCRDAACICFLLSEEMDGKYVDDKSVVLAKMLGNALSSYIKSEMDLDNWLFVCGESEEQISTLYAVGLK